MLVGARARAAEDLVARLSSTLLARAPDARHGVGLARGLAGTALAHAHLSRLFPGRSHLERARAELELALETSSESEDYGLFTGATGVAFVLEHLTNEGLLDADEASTAELCGSFVEDPTHLASTFVHHDVVRGTAGLLLYATECRGRHASLPLLDLCARRLRDAAERTDDDRASWRATPALAGERSFDVGLAHGQAGIAAALAHATTVCLDHDLAAFARSAQRGLAAMRVETARGEPEASAEASTSPRSCHYPAFVSTVGAARVSTDARNAWCYGDAGTSAAALFIEARMGVRDVGARVAARGAVAAARVDRTIEGSSLCHGTASLAHVFRRLHEATREDTFADAANGWFDRMLVEVRPGALETGLLEGAAGVALVLAGAISESCDTWDVPFLLRISSGETARAR